MRRSKNLTGSPQGAGLSQTDNTGFPAKLGDVNADGKINATDALLAARIAQGLDDPSPEKKARADVDGDGTVTENDATLIEEYFLGKIDRFPAGNQAGNGGGGDGRNGGGDAQQAGINAGALWVGGGILGIGALVAYMSSGEDSSYWASSSR